MLTNFGVMRTHGLGVGDLEVEVKNGRKSEKNFMFFSFFCIFNYNTRLKISLCIIWDLGVSGLVVGDK